MTEQAGDQRQPDRATRPATPSQTLLRILIIRNAFSYDFGGGERFPVDLAVELRKLGFSPTVISRSNQLLDYAASCDIPHIRGWWWRRQNWSGYRIILTPLYYIWQIILCFWYIRLIARLQPDVIHPQSKDDFIAATWAGRLLGKHVIWTDHADLKYIYQNHAVWYKNPVGKLVFAASKRAQAVTLVSDSEKQLISAALAPHKLPAQYHVVHNGVTDTAITAISRPRQDQDSFVFCATSRLVTAKGIGELVVAFTKLQSTYTNTRLWLLGDGPDANQFKQQAANNPAITFFGHQSQPLPYVAAADVFVHPSYHEGFSLSLVEATMLGKPIIACNVGGNPEIVIDEQTGLLIPPRDEAALYTAMEQLYNNRPLAKELGSNARQNYVRDFQFDVIVARTFAPFYKTGEWL